MIHATQAATKQEVQATFDQVAEAITQVITEGNQRFSRIETALFPDPNPNPKVDEDVPPTSLHDRIDLLERRFDRLIEYLRVKQI
jgi:hypothetical protein